MRDYTDITILLDRSGSMASIRDRMESGFKEFLQEHSKNNKTRLTLVQFNSVNRYDTVYENLPVGAVHQLNLNPHGGTPLIDAFVKCIDETGKRLNRMNEKERPKRVLFLVITDGEENASFLHKKADVKERVERQTSKYGWNFIFLGANQDAIAEGASYGINAASSVNFSGIEAYSALQLLSLKTAAYASTGNMRSLTYTDDERKKLISKI